MKKQEYLASLFEENKQCSCDYLARFFFLEEKFNELENFCNDLQDCFFILDKISSENKKLYEQKNYERRGFYNKLNRELNLLIKKGKLNLFYYNDENNYEKQSIDYKQGKKLKDKIIIASCSECIQQIRVLQ